MSEFDFIENNTVREDTDSAEQETATSFQDELKNNMRSKEDVEKEYEERIRKDKERQKKKWKRKQCSRFRK